MHFSSSNFIISLTLDTIDILEKLIQISVWKE